MKPPSLPQRQIEIKRDDKIVDPQVLNLLKAHLQSMYDVTPEEFTFTLPVDELRQQDCELFVARVSGEVAGCIVLKRLDSEHAELKSTHTLQSFRRLGIGQKLLHYAITEAKASGYTRLSLETGVTEPFIPAIKLYQLAGFEDCDKFSDYPINPHSRFMTLKLTGD